LQEQGQGQGQIQDPRLGQGKAGKGGPGNERSSERKLRNSVRSGEDRLRDGVISSDEQKLRRQETNAFSREKLKDVTRQRKEHREEGGRVVIKEPGNRQIERDGGQVIIRNDETERLKGPSKDFRVEKGEGGKNRIIITRSDGDQIITIQGKDGQLLRRIKRSRDGQERILINNEFRHERRFRDRDRDRDRDGRGRGGFAFYLDLPEFVVNIPQEEYYVDADEASEDEIEQALSAPPIEELEGDYTLDEIRYNKGLRQRLRRVNLDTINFEFGAWDIRQEQIGNLQEVADAIKSILRRSPDEVFLVAGHTDSVGSDEDNLSLSDRRAETVARVLTDEFGVPPENLVTQGYGEQDLLIPTDQPEIRNRRVEFMNITRYLAQKDQ
jgi:outer membrane protein OmpA-like peptidoglycan-associated protein